MSNGRELAKLAPKLAAQRELKLNSEGSFSFRNKIINGNMRINQRGFNGTWTGLAEGAYGFDRWKRAGTNIQQVIEEGNFKPNTVHTLSGTGVTAQQITSPATGHWTITVPNTATNVQVEEGLVATPFEHRPVGLELALCQRYHYTFTQTVIGAYPTGNAGAVAMSRQCYPVTMRVTPTLSAGQVTQHVNGGAVSYLFMNQSPQGFDIQVGNSYASAGVFGATFAGATASAEL